MEIKSYIRHDLKDYIPYNAKECDYKLKLDANEIPFKLPTPVKKNIIKWLNNSENLNRYPNTDSIDLKRALSEYWNLKIKNIICGVGSDQIIDYICKTFLEPDDIVCVPDPSFSMYSLTAKLNRAKVVPIELDQNLEYDTAKIINVCKANNPKLLFLCSPNNPTGNTIKCKDIKKILKEIKCPVVVDEAYAEFSDETMIPYINKYRNMIVLRTFSKAYGLAGLRIGYGVANKSFIESLEIVKMPFNLNTFSQIVAIEMLKYQALTSERVEYLKSEREWLLKKLKDIKFITSYKSESNFIYIESNLNLAKHLKSKGILIRDFKACDGVYKSRLTVGTRAENKKLLKELKKAKSLL